ncbi:MAG TPA: hypothetical protein VGV65_08475 [Nocardioides sp.]|nr:hypothetical protein [Nocardioides sp.]
MSDLRGTLDRATVRDEGDALAVLGWGLRHYAWILVLSICALGIAVPLAADRAPETYEAQAQVGPAVELTLDNIDPLPRVAESLFRNGRVASAVRRSFEPPLPASQEVIPQRVSLIAAQDNVVLTVVGRGSDPREAAGLATVAAETLRDQLNRYENSVGLFAVQQGAVPPGTPVPRLGMAPAIGMGVLAGVLVGLGLIGLLLLRRRPVLSVENAEAATGARVLGQVWLGRSSGETRGLPQLCHTILSSGCEELLLVGTRRSASYRHQLTGLLVEVLMGRRDVVPVDDLHPERPRARAKGRSSGAAPRLLVTQDATPPQLVGRSGRSVAVLVVPYGIRRASLVRQVEQYLDGGAAGVLLVRKARRRLRPAKAEPTTEPEHRAPSALGTPINGIASRNGSSPGSPSGRTSGAGGSHQPGPS